MSNDIVGTYDLAKKLEDIVVLVENTRSNYGNTDIVVEIEAGIMSMVDLKLSLEPKTRFALVTYSDTANTELEFEDFSRENIEQALYNIDLAETDVSDISEGMSKAFEVTVKSMQKMAEGKRFRIMIISGGSSVGTSEKWEELLNICEKVGIYIDTLQIARAFAPTDNILETISKRTESFYYKIEDISELEPMLSNLIPAKVETGADKLQSAADRDMKGLLEVIAADLISLSDGIKTVEDLKNLVNQKDEKCGICHSPDCMFCKGPAFSCGAFCPSCNRFYHKHCCAGWAEAQKDTPKTVFKCPVCFHLLKIPGSLHRISILKQHLNDSAKLAMKHELKKININELGVKGAYKYCSWCKNVFSPNEDVYTCGGCGAFYHIDDCMDAMVEKTQNRCRLCDSPFGASVRKTAGIERIV